MDPGEVVRRLWQRIEARDWGGVADLVAEDAVVDWPNTAERIRGRDNYVTLNREYPEGWSIDVLRIVAAGDEAAAEVRVPQGDETFFCAGFYRVDDGRIARATEYWSDGRPGEAPQWRAHLVERLDGT
jgi:ketosteroid isomerase-like protein